MKVSALPNDELVRVYVMLRDEEGRLKKAKDELKLKREKIEAVLLQRYQEAGIESARTAYGTAYKQVVTFASVGDRDSFMNHVKENEAYELMEVRCSKDAVQQYVNEHNDLPPGVNWREELHIRVQRS